MLLFNVYMFLLIGSPHWQYRGISSSIVYADMIVLNVLQSIFLVFVVSESWSLEKEAHTTGSLYTRSFANFEYISGKCSGIFALFFSIQLLILFMAFIIDAVFMPDVPVKLVSYVIYPFLITIPSFFFIYGATLFTASLLKSRAFTLILLLTCLYLSFYHLRGKANYMFDSCALYLPLTYSHIIGFGNVKTILIIRGAYFLLGIILICMSVLFFKRLPQSKIMNRISFSVGLISIVMCLTGGYLYVSSINAEEILRREMKLLNTTYAQKPRVTISDCALDFKHDGKEIEITADLVFKNETPDKIDEYIFSLNPGLEVNALTRNGKSLKYECNHQILLIEPFEKSLAPGCTDSLTISYAGTIDENVCYLDIDDTYRNEPYSASLYKIEKRYSFIYSDYVLLISENLWYPVPGIPHTSTSNSQKDFIHFTLDVTTDRKLTAISQGTMSKVSEGEFIFRPEIPLPQISLTIGNYKKESVSVDNIEYSIYRISGHEVFSDELRGVTDELPEMISHVKNGYENRLHLTYPYNRLTFIEVPIQFYAYDRYLTLSQETTQPEQVYIHERGLFLMSFNYKSYLHFIKRKETKAQQEIMRSYISQLSRQNFTSHSPVRYDIRSFHKFGFYQGSEGGYIHDYKLFPNFYNYVNSFQNDRHPLIDNVVANVFLSKLQNEYLFETGKIAACQALNNHNILDVIHDPDKNYLIYNVLKLKSNYLEAFVKNKIGDNNFNDFFSQYLEENRFKKIDTKKLFESFKHRLGFDLEKYYETWLTATSLPAFVFSELNYNEVYGKNDTQFQISFSVTNTGNVEGAVLVKFAGNDPFERYVVLEGNQTKEVSLVVPEHPRGIIIDTIMSQNVPLSTRIEFKERVNKISPEEHVFYDGEKILDTPVSLSNPGEIIVDNESDNFTILTHPQKSILQKLFFRKESTQESLPGTFFISEPPDRWKRAYSQDYYGKIIKSVYVIKSGKGDQRVQWRANIPEDGIYNVYCSKIDFDSKSAIVNDFNFYIYHEDDIDEKTVNMKIITDKWVLIGTYYFTKGTSKVELTDKSHGLAVYADAVKWVKK